MTRKRIAALLLFFLFLAVYLKTQIWEVYIADSGELTATAYVLGIAHPTGYPVYDLISKAFSLVPLGNIASRIALGSAVCSATAVAFLFSFLAMEFSLLPASAAAILFGQGLTFWSQAVVQEVYALHILFISILLYLLICFKRNNTLRSFYLFCFFLGLSSAHHLLTVMVFPAFVYVLLKSKIAKSDRLIFLIGGVLPAVLGWSVQLLIPIRSFNECVIRWQPVHDYVNFWSLITGKQFHSSMFHENLGVLLASSGRFFAKLFEQWYLLIPLAAIPGALVAFKRRKSAFIILLLFFLATFVFVINYRIIDIEVYFIQAYILFVFLIAAAFQALIDALVGKRYRLLRTLSVILLAVLFFSGLIRNYFFNDRSVNSIPYTYGVDIFNTVPPDSVLITQGWSTPFVFSYLEHVLHYRPDILVPVDQNGIHFRQSFREKWVIPVLSTVPVELPGLEDTDFQPWGLAYWFEQKDAEIKWCGECWEKLRLPKLNLQDVFLEFHSSALIAKAHYIRGDWYLRTGKSRLGIAELQEAERIAGDNYFVLNNLSGIYFKAGYYKKAEEFARRSLTINGDFKIACHNLANALFKQGRYREAIELYQKSGTDSNSMGRTYQALGYALMKERKYKEAKDAFKTALRFNKALPEIKLDLAVAYCQINEMEKSEKLFQELLKTKKNSPAVLNDYAMLLLRKGYIRLAESFFKQVLEKVPEDRNALLNLGICEAKTGQWGEAESCFKKILERNPKDINALNNLGLVFFRTGRTNQAAEVWKQSVYINPDQPDVFANLRATGINASELEQFYVVSSNQ